MFFNGRLFMPESSLLYHCNLLGMLSDRLCEHSLQHCNLLKKFKKINEKN